MARPSLFPDSRNRRRKEPRNDRQFQRSRIPLISSRQAEMPRRPRTRSRQSRKQGRPPRLREFSSRRGKIRLRPPPRSQHRAYCERRLHRWRSRAGWQKGPRRWSRGKFRPGSATAEIPCPRPRSSPVGWRESPAGERGPEDPFCPIARIPHRRLPAAGGCHGRSVRGPTRPPRLLRSIPSPPWRD